MKFITFLVLIFSGFVNAAISSPPNFHMFKVMEMEGKYLFYIHGKIIEDQGINAESEEYGPYKYREILARFEENGFSVISEVREKNTNPKEYSSKIINQIQKLIDEGVTPGNITIVGVSKGSVISMLISSKLKNRDVNFVLIANCNDWVKENFDIDLYGNILSIFESSDTYGQSCNSIFSSSTGLNVTKEIKLDLGIGHGIIYMPLDEWMIPTIEWAKRE